MHRAPGAFEQGVVHRDHHRLPGRDQVGDDQPGQDCADLLDRPPGMGEEPVRPVVGPHPRQPGPDQHAADRAPTGL